MYTVLYFGLATAGLHYFALVLAEKYQRWQALRVFAKHHKTKPARRENPWDVLGIYKVVAMARLVIKGTSLDGAIDLFQRLGRTYSSKILTQPVLFTCDPRNMRHVLITAFTDFDSSRGIRDHLFRPITPHGIFALDGNEWKTARRLYRDHFSRTRDIVDLDLQERCFRNLEALIPSDNTPFDLQPLFLRLMLDLTTAFAMGVCVDSLRPDQSVEKKRFVDALIHVKKTMARDGFLGPVHVFLSKKEFHASCSTVQHFVEDIIRQKLAVSRPKDKSDSQEDVATAVESCFLDKLMEGSGDVIELRDGVLTLLIAGIDSVASLLSTATFLLSRHQAAQDKLRASILDKVGYELPSFNDLRGLAYLRYVFNESKPHIPCSSSVRDWGQADIYYQQCGSTLLFRSMHVQPTKTPTYPWEEAPMERIVCWWKRGPGSCSPRGAHTETSTILEEMPMNSSRKGGKTCRPTLWRALFLLTWDPEPVLAVSPITLLRRT